MDEKRQLAEAVILLSKGLTRGNVHLHQDGYGGICRCGDCEKWREALLLAKRVVNEEGLMATETLYICDQCGTRWSPSAFADPKVTRWCLMSPDHRILHSVDLCPHCADEAREQLEAHAATKPLSLVSAETLPVAAES